MHVTRRHAAPATVDCPLIMRATGSQRKPLLPSVAPIVPVRRMTDMPSSTISVRLSAWLTAPPAELPERLDYTLG